jgi:hypothetical protein
MGRRSQSIIGWSLDLPLTSTPGRVVSGGTTVAMNIAQTQATVDAYVASLLRGELDAELAITHLLVGPGIASHEATLIGARLSKVAGALPNRSRLDIQHSVFYDLANGKIIALRVHGLTDDLFQHHWATGEHVALTDNGDTASHAL